MRIVPEPSPESPFTVAREVAELIARHSQTNGDITEKQGLGLIVPSRNILVARIAIPNVIEDDAPLQLNGPNSLNFLTVYSPTTRRQLGGICVATLINYAAFTSPGTSERPLTSAEVASFLSEHQLCNETVEPLDAASLTPSEQECSASTLALVK